MKNYTDLDIINNTKNVKSMSALLRSLGLKPCGGNYISFKRKLQRLQLDTSHWTGQLWNKDQQLKDWSQYTQVTYFKKHLIILRGHKCESCGLSSWLNRPITLEIHHIDGNRTNNNLNNLQLLCPNCHSTTDNWRGRNNLGSSPSICIP